MNAINTNKLISNIQSFADRLRNDDRSSIMFEADWDTLMEAKDRLDQQEAEIKRLKKSYEPDMFWNNDDPEQSHSSVNNVVVSAYENGDLEVGNVIEIQQAIKLENIKVRITLTSDDGDLEWEQVV